MATKRLLLVIGAAIVLAACGGGSMHHAATPADPAALLGKGAKATYHAVYQATGDPKLIGGNLTVEVWQAPPRFREDTILRTGTHTEHTAEVSDGKSGQSCVEQDSGPWTCHALPTGEAQTTGGAGLVAGVEAAMRSGSTVVTKRIGGQNVQCFVSSQAGGPEVCAGGNGIPVLIANGKVTYQLSSLERAVDRSVFVTPS